jgi:hypothetical protein
MNRILSALSFSVVESSHRTQHATISDVDVDLETVPEQPVAQQPSTLRLKFRRGGQPVQLTLSHDRILHAFIVDREFSSFAHTHPEDAGMTKEQQESSTFDLHHIFPHDGEFLVAVDYAEEDRHGSSKFLVNVLGTKAEPSFNLAREQEVGHHWVRLDAPECVVAKKRTQLTFHIMKDGEDAEDLEPYLAAPLHLAVIKQDFKPAMHVHGELPTTHAELPEQFGPDVRCDVTFPTAGRYHLFAEFKHLGKVVQTHFTLDVS